MATQPRAAIPTTTFRPVDREARLTVADVLAQLRKRVECVISGHDRYSLRTGDWVCTRCGRQELVEVPLVSTRLGVDERRAELPRFD